MPHQNQEYSYQNKNNKLGAQLPRPIIQSTDHIYQHDKVSYRKNMLGFPPADSLFSSDNNYDGGPEFIRPTSAMMMGNPKKRNFPYGAWIMPFGSDNVKEVKVDAPLRCSRCKAYINPYFRLDGTKSSAHCNICGIKFDIENGMSNKNLNNTSLMTQGVIDFEVKDKMYIKKRLDIIKVVIAIEMGQFMYESGIFGNIIEGVKSAI